VTGPTGKQIAAHLHMVFAAVPTMVKTLLARADSGFYCWDAVQAYESVKCGFIIVARKTARLVEELKAAQWQRSPQTRCRRTVRVLVSAGWLGESVPVPGAALREEGEGWAADAVEQYQCSRRRKYIYRVFVDEHGWVDTRVGGVLQQRAAAENLIKEANNDAGLAAHPSGLWMLNCIWFQIAMLAYNLNCWLQLFNREEGGEVGGMRHTTLATARLRFLFLAAKIWRHAGRVGISYSDHYEDQGLFQRLMDRVRAIAPGGDGFLRC